MKARKFDPVATRQHRKTNLRLIKEMSKDTKNRIFKIHQQKSWQKTKYRK